MRGSHHVGPGVPPVRGSADRRDALAGGRRLVVSDAAYDENKGCQARWQVDAASSCPMPPLCCMQRGLIHTTRGSALPACCSRAAAAHEELFTCCGAFKPPTRHAYACTCVLA